MKQKINNIKNKIKDFFSDEKKRVIFILILVIILLTGVIVSVLIYQNNENKKNENLPTTTTTTTTKAIVTINNTENVFKGYNIKELDDTNYELDLKARHEIIYADNNQDRIMLSVNDIEYYYEINLKDGKLVFKELQYDKVNNLESYTGKIYEFGENITNFIIGHNTPDISYTLVAMDKAGNIYQYVNEINSNNSITEVIKSIAKVKIISTAKKIGYYNYNNDPFMDMKLSKMVYVDKNNNLRVLDGQNTLFYDTVFYRFIGDDSRGEVVYVLKNKLMQFSNDDNYLNDGLANIEYRGSFYTDDDLFIISKDKKIYKIPLGKEDYQSLVTPFKEVTIKRIGNRVVGENNFATNKNDLLIEFDNEEIIKITNVLEYELLP